MILDEIAQFSVLSQFGNSPTRWLPVTAVLVSWFSRFCTRLSRDPRSYAMTLLAQVCSRKSKKWPTRVQTVTTRCRSSSRPLVGSHVCHCASFIVAPTRDSTHACAWLWLTV